MDENKRIKKKLLRITWPIFVESLLLSTLGTVDTLMVSRYSDNAVAAVGVSNQIINMINLLFVVITAGTSILVAQYIGANKDGKKSNEIFQLCGMSIGYNALIGLVLSLILSFLGIEFLKLLNTSNDILYLANDFLKIVGGFIFIQAISMTFTAILRPHGYVKICMYVTLLINVINAILNYILIFGKFGAPELGVVGSALGTTISKFIGLCILGGFVYIKILKGYSIKLLWPLPLIHLKNVMTIGIPSAGENMSYSLAQLALMSFINTISVETVTTRSYVNNIVSFAVLFSAALAQGNGIIVGRLIGEKKNDAALNFGFFSIKKAIILSTGMAGIFAILGHPLMRIFTENQEIIKLGATVIWIDVILEIGRATNVVGIGALKAVGDVKFPVVIGVFSMWVIAVGLGYVLSIPCGLGLIGIWIGLASDECFRAILVIFRWKNRKWEGKAFV
ncbi:MATE family efflux transporter [Clostridium sp. C2-6-12]|uniref:MATE family efflux transporter n=1 Tax=Clostridium sp. C2-6-12 TaxID=2698832 RepID=UPI0013718D7B|nr:MATE family efflux transporter [Clostridium sp. C2-6-12]